MTPEKTSGRGSFVHTRGQSEAHRYPVHLFGGIVTPFPLIGRIQPSKKHRLDCTGQSQAPVVLLESPAGGSYSFTFSTQGPSHGRGCTAEGASTSALTVQIRSGPYLIDDRNPMDDSRRCTATAKSTGERCKRAAIPGGEVCSMHGGSAPQVKKKAQERLDAMADSTTADLQRNIADLQDEYESADDIETKLSIQSEMRRNWKIILDRTGHGPTAKRELEHSGEIEGFDFTINASTDD